MSGYEERPEETPEISTLQYSSIEKKAKYQPLNLAGLARTQKKFSFDPFLKKAKPLLKKVLERLAEHLPALPPLPETHGALAEEKKENLSSFRYDIPLDQEWISRPSLNERRNARIRARFRRLVLATAVLLSIPIVTLLLRQAKPINISLFPNRPTHQAAASPQPSPAAVTYTVRSGDYWGSIASRYGISAEKLASSNGKSTVDILRPGDRLSVPKGKGFVHVVRRGDNVSTLLARYGTSLAEFKKANPIGSLHNLRVGQKLYFNPR